MQFQDGDTPLEAEPKKPKYYRVAHEILTSERTQVFHNFSHTVCNDNTIIMQVCTSSMVFGKGKLFSGCA